MLIDEELIEELGTNKTHSRKTSGAQNNDDTSIQESLIMY
jgi:hypothetical protein